MYRITNRPPPSLSLQRVLHHHQIACVLLSFRPRFPRFVFLSAVCRFVVFDLLHDPIFPLVHLWNASLQNITKQKVSLLKLIHYKRFLCPLIWRALRRGWRKRNSQESSKGCPSQVLLRSSRNCLSQHGFVCQEKFRGKLWREIFFLFLRKMLTITIALAKVFFFPYDLI